jgi:hypothetical protein
MIRIERSTPHPVGSVNVTTVCGLAPLCCTLAAAAPATITIAPEAEKSVPVSVIVRGAVRGQSEVLPVDTSSVQPVT